MIHCYILYSATLNKFYTGVTILDVEQRIVDHINVKHDAKSFTAKAKDWELFFVIQVENLSHGIKLEKKIKSQKSSKFIRNLKKYPELVEKIKNEALKMP